MNTLRYEFTSRSGQRYTVIIKAFPGAHLGVLLNSQDLELHRIEHPIDFDQILQEMCEAIRAVK